MRSAQMSEQKNACVRVLFALFIFGIIYSFLDHISKRSQPHTDIKGPIKGRARKKSLRKGRTLRILGDEEQRVASELSKVGMEVLPRPEQKTKRNE